MKSSHPETTIHDLALGYGVPVNDVLRICRNMCLHNLKTPESFVRPSIEVKIRKALEESGHVRRNTAGVTNSGRNKTTRRNLGRKPALFKSAWRVDVDTGRFVEQLENHTILDPRFWDEVLGSANWNVNMAATQEDISVVDQSCGQVFVVSRDEVHENGMFPEHIKRNPPYVEAELHLIGHTQQYWSDKLLNDDIKKGRICIPDRYRIEARSMFPYVVRSINVLLRGTQMACEWDPMGQVDGRVGVIQVGRKLAELVEEGEILSILLTDTGQYRIQ